MRTRNGIWGFAALIVGLVLFGALNATGQLQSQAQPEQQIQGSVLSFNLASRRMQVRQPDGRILTVSIDPAAAVTLDGQAGTLSQLQVGQEVTIQQGDRNGQRSANVISATSAAGAPQGASGAASGAGSLSAPAGAASGTAGGSLRSQPAAPSSGASPASPAGTGSAPASSGAGSPGAGSLNAPAPGSSSTSAPSSSSPSGASGMSSPAPSGTSSGGTQAR